MDTITTIITWNFLPAEEIFHDHIRRYYDDARWSNNAIPPILFELQERAQKLKLWNLFLPPRLWSKLPSNLEEKYRPSTPLTYREYGILAESMGKSEFGAMACNCSAPDTGNMEVLLEFGTLEQQQEYLLPLLKGSIRSTFLMTEPHV
jgi:acyl-CoA dehydrogenase